MKRILTLFLLVLLIAAGCSKEPQTTPAPPPAANTAQPVPPATHPTAEPAPESPHTHPLTGQPLAEAPGNLRPYAIMINNISVALPQCGISKADIIYEVLAEGGITRMLAIYSDLSDAGSIGSMRSVRPYFLDIAKAYDAIVVHAGGSEDAYWEISVDDLDTIDGVRGRFAEEIFYRDSSRMGAGYEHSLFTSADRVLEYTPLLGCRQEHQGIYDYGLTFSEKAMPAQGETARFLKVAFGSSKSSSFTYDESDGLYYVTQYGSDYVDGNTEDPVGFKNLLVLFADTITLNDAYAHLDIDLTGRGSGYFACEGMATEISWSRSSSGGVFHYELPSGPTLSLGVGTTYICIVPTAIDQVEIS